MSTSNRLDLGTLGLSTGYAQKSPRTLVWCAYYVVIKAIFVCLLSALVVLNSFIEEVPRW